VKRFACARNSTAGRHDTRRPWRRLRRDRTSHETHAAHARKRPGARSARRRSRRAPRAARLDPAHRPHAAGHHRRGRHAHALLRAQALTKPPHIAEGKRTVATTIMTNCTCAKDNPERAILSFIVGNVAASADQPAIVLLTIEGVWLATKGYADDIVKDGFQPLKDIMASFIENGGQIW